MYSIVALRGIGLSDNPVMVSLKGKTYAGLPTKNTVRPRNVYIGAVDITASQPRSRLLCQSVSFNFR